MSNYGQQPNPYGQNPQPGQNPYGPPGQQPPYGPPQGQPQQQPYGQPQQGQQPWGQPARPPQPGQQPPPYGQPQQGQPSGQQPWGQPGQQPPYAQPGQPGPQPGPPGGQPGQPAGWTPQPASVARPVLPSRAIAVTTTAAVPGREVAAVIGDVVGVVVRPRELPPELRVGNPIDGYAAMLTRSRQDAVTKMIDMAVGAGADAVIGFGYDSSEITQSLSEIAAFGTAVKLAPEAGGVDGRPHSRGGTKEWPRSGGPAADDLAAAEQGTGRSRGRRSATSRRRPPPEPARDDRRDPDRGRRGDHAEPAGGRRVGRERRDRWPPSSWPSQS